MIILANLLKLLDVSPVNYDEISTMPSINPEQPNLVTLRYWSELLLQVAIHFPDVRARRHQLGQGLPVQRRELAIVGMKLVVETNVLILILFVRQD